MLSLASLQTPLRSVKVPDPLERKKSLADLQNTEQQMQLRNLQMQEAQGGIAAQDAAAKKAAAIQGVLENATWDEATGMLDAKTLQAIDKIDGSIGASLRKQYQDVASSQSQVKIAQSKEQRDSAETAWKTIQDKRKASLPIRSEAAPGTLITEADPQTGKETRRETVPFKPDTPTVRNIDPLSAEGIQAAVQRERQLTPFQREPDEPLVAIIGDDGQPVFVPRSQAVGKRPAPSSQSRPPSEGERTALRFYERMKGAAEDLAAVEETINALGMGGQVRLKFAPNFAQTSEGQRYTQAQRAFTEARLRKDSGAAIPPQEFENDRQTYFVQPGDDKKLIEQKRKSRETALTALRRSAARAYEETYGESPTAPRGGGGNADPLGVR